MFFILTIVDWFTHFIFVLQLSSKAAAARKAVPLPPIRNKVEVERLKQKQAEQQKA